MEPTEHVARLYQHGEKTLPAPVKAGLFSCCPTMDLIAVVCHDAQVDVYRLNGQRAFGFSPLKPTSNITALCWKFNGTSLAVGWEDGSIDVISAETGKVLQHISNTHVDVPGASRDAVKPVATLGWGLSFVNSAAVKAKLKISSDGRDEDGEDVALDDFLARLPEPRLLDLDPNLPDQLAALDLEGQLPRLSPLAPLPAVIGSKANHVQIPEAFSSQTSLDALLHPRKGADLNTTDILLRMEADGVTLPVLYGSLALRPLRRPAGLADVLPLRHAYNPFATSHMILAKAELPSISGGTRHLALLPLTLPFMRAASRHTQTIPSKAAKVQTLLSYISACLDSVTYHWRQSQDLPAKFMRVISDTLAENEEMDLVPSLYHLAVTGHCTPSIKEWLTDQLMERGHKRWDHAVKLGYTKIVELTHENLLPAIDLCTLLVSNLRGLATYYRDTGVFDVPPRRMTVTIEALQCLRILCHHIIHYASTEKKQFGAFSKWLRYEIDTRSTDQASNDETAEQDPGIDYSQALAYIEGPLMESRLKPFVCDVVDGLLEIPAEDMTSALISKHVEAIRAGNDYHAFAVSIKAHFAALRSNSDQLFDLVVEWQLANSAYHMAILLDEADVICADLRMNAEEARGPTAHITTYAALVPSRETSQVHIYRILHREMLVGEKCILEKLGSIVSFGDRQVRDIRFADDQFLIVLLQGHDGLSIHSVPYGAASARYEPLQSSVVRSTDRHAELVTLGRPRQASGLSSSNIEQADAGQHLRHTFQTDAVFSAGSLEINGRKDRRVIYVLSQDQRHYQALDLDNQATSSEDLGPRTVDTVMDIGGG